MHQNSDVCAIVHLRLKKAQAVANALSLCDCTECNVTLLHLLFAMTSALTSLSDGAYDM